MRLEERVGLVLMEGGLRREEGKQTEAFWEKRIKRINKHKASSGGPEGSWFHLMSP